MLPAMVSGELQPRRLLSGREYWRVPYGVHLIADVPAQSQSSVPDPSLVDFIESDQVKVDVQELEHHVHREGLYVSTNYLVSPGSQLNYLGGDKPQDTSLPHRPLPHHH